MERQCYSLESITRGVFRICLDSGRRVCYFDVSSLMACQQLRSWICWRQSRVVTVNWAVRAPYLSPATTSSDEFIIQRRVYEGSTERSINTYGAGLPDDHFTCFILFICFLLMERNLKQSFMWRIFLPPPAPLFKSYENSICVRVCCFRKRFNDFLRDFSLTVC